ncbi:hypothetical protein NpPPO83_00010468 [Neofusicoccum parvum]|uniref:Uncharacterized protein n=1 Tax=Neofusicoccum parvum TaxID=310453 RepID=A0ACB5RVE2_9PEZI|nr:hypothetical protein NpPPO83_00010468 [Neofusicoccum parvum]
MLVGRLGDSDRESERLGKRVVMPRISEISESTGTLVGNGPSDEVIPRRFEMIESMGILVGNGPSPVVIPKRLDKTESSGTLVGRVKERLGVPVMGDKVRGRLGEGIGLDERLGKESGERVDRLRPRDCDRERLSCSEVGSTGDLVKLSTICESNEETIGSGRAVVKPSTLESNEDSCGPSDERDIEDGPLSDSKDVLADEGSRELELDGIDNEDTSTLENWLGRREDSSSDTETDADKLTEGYVAELRVDEISTSSLNNELSMAESVEATLSDSNSEETSGSTVGAIDDAGESGDTRLVGREKGPIALLDGIVNENVVLKVDRLNALILGEPSVEEL